MIVDSILGLAIQVLKLINTAKARKYHDDLVELQLKKIAMDALPPEQVDDVAYVKLINELDVVAKAAMNDPALGVQSTGTS